MVEMVLRDVFAATDVNLLPGTFCQTRFICILPRGNNDERKNLIEMRYYVSLKSSLMHVSGTKLAAARLDQRCFVTASYHFDLRYLIDP